MNDRNEHVRFFVDETPETTRQAVAGILATTKNLIKKKRDEIKERKCNIAYRRIMRDINELTNRI